MPVQYAGVLEEHLAVRERAGMFDVSHMGEVEVRGRGALDFLQRITCNDVSKLQPGRAHYTALTTPAGTFVDDLLVYRLADDDFLLVVNASNTPKDFAWIEEHARGADAHVRNASAEWGQIAVQGPLALRVVAPLVDGDIAGLRYYAFAKARVEGVPCLVSRTGYTGEDGFEIYGPADEAPRIWKALVRSGGPHGLVPVGLGARDTLRLEAKMALYGNDIDDTTTVLEADLGWIVKLEKGDFLGRDALVHQKEEGIGRKLVGFEMRGRAIARHGYAALRAGERVGVVTSGSFAPHLKRNIGLAYLPRGMWDPGTRFDVEIRGRMEPAEVVATPFYKRAR
jgi:aminomethyltransferase